MIGFTWLFGFSLPGVLLTFLTCILLWRTFVGTKKSRLIDKIPGPHAYPIVGNILEMIIPTTEVTTRALERRRKYGPIYRLWMGPKALVTVSSAEHVETILASTTELKKGFMYRIFKPWLGNGLVTSFGPRWFKHRKMITPTFHFTILDSFVPTFESNSKVLVENLRSYSLNGEIFDIFPKINHCALDIICETAMGINLHAQIAQSSTQSPYISSIVRVSRLMTERGQRFYLHNDTIYKMTNSFKEMEECLQTLHEFTENTIRERKAQRKMKEVISPADDGGIKKKKAFLDLLLDADTDLSDADLREEVDTFMFAGHDTTTAGTSWAIYLLGTHPEIQESVADEVLSIWPSGETLTMKHLNEMKLLERVIKESHRVFPAVGQISRTLINDMKFGEYIVPAGSYVNINIHGLHHDESVFPEPEKFVPDRFLLENVQSRHPYAFVPFSAGSRNCIGQKFALLEEKSLIANLIREFKIESIERREEIPLVSELILRPKNGIKVRIQPRF